jgi:predicted HTH domain antitoxin
MKILITAIFGFAVAFLELGFQLYYQFDRISFRLFIVLEILCLACLICGSLLLMPIIKSERRDKELKILRSHFTKDILEASSNIIPISREYGGQLYPGNSPEFSPEFRAHFPKEVATWNTYCSSVKIHNEKYREFVQRPRNVFESAGLSVFNCQTQVKSPYIYEMIFALLFLWWSSHSGHFRYPTIDFTKIDTNLSVCGNLCNLYVSGCNSSAIAYAENETDRQKCKDLITKVAFNLEYEGEAVGLTKLAEGIAKSINDLQSQLTSRIQNIDRYWPTNAGTKWGTKEYQFRRLRDECLICRRLPR